jgi:predicted small metal-binding protein
VSRGRQSLQLDGSAGDADTRVVGVVTRNDRGDVAGMLGRLRRHGRKEFEMAKVLRCGDLMPGCSAVIEGKDEAEVMAKGAEHAKTAHKMTSIPPDIAAKVKAAIKDKK